MPKLTSRQRRHLRGLAHGLKPVVRIGKGGITEGVLRTIDEALAHHELIKVRLSGVRGDNDGLCATIEARLGCERVGTIGHVAIFYRPAADAEDRRIELPG